MDLSALKKIVPPTCDLASASPSMKVSFCFEAPFFSSFQVLLACFIFSSASASDLHEKGVNLSFVAKCLIAFELTLCPLSFLVQVFNIGFPQELL